MIKLEKLFENVFDDDRIISSRLSNFAANVLQHLGVTNENGINNSLIALLQPALDGLRAELNDVDAAKSLHRGTTLSVDQFITDFTNKMSLFESGISYALGGSKTAAYLEFFPNGLTEYTNPRKVQMPLLVGRLKAAAAKYAGKLDPAIAGQLQEFESTWQKVRNDQMQQKASLTDGRTYRSDARKKLEIALLVIIYSIGLRYPGNVTACMAFFDVKLLYNQGRKKQPEKTPAGL